MSTEMRTARAVKDVADKATRLHYEVATSPAREVSSGQSAVYTASRALMVTALKAAYPDVDPDAVYRMYVDTGESLTYCVRLVRQGLSADDTGPLDGIPVA